MDQVTDQLWISDAQAADQLPSDHRFDEVVTLGYYEGEPFGLPESSTTGDGFVFENRTHDFDTFAAAVDFVLTALEHDKRVLIHCKAGVSRSAGVCSTVVAVREDVSADDALRTVRKASPKVHPSPQIKESMERYLREKSDQWDAPASDTAEASG